MIRAFAVACVLVAGCSPATVAQVRPAAAAVCVGARAACRFVNVACAAVDATSGGSEP